MPTPPPFPTVTLHTPDGDVTMPCEPVGEHLAIVAALGMTEGEQPGTFKAMLTGAFDIVLRTTGKSLATGGCISCARDHAEVLAVWPGINWGADEAELQAQVAKLPEATRREFASGADLSWGCDAEWCDRTGPGIVTIPVP
jgi:hypothetical protein